MRVEDVAGADGVVGAVLVMVVVEEPPPQLPPEIRKNATPMTIRAPMITPTMPIELLRSRSILSTILRVSLVKPCRQGDRRRICSRFAQRDPVRIGPRYSRC